MVFYKIICNKHAKYIKNNFGAVGIAVWLKSKQKTRYLYSVNLRHISLRMLGIILLCYFLGSSRLLFIYLSYVLGISSSVLKKILLLTPSYKPWTIRIITLFFRFRITRFLAMLSYRIACYIFENTEQFSDKAFHFCITWSYHLFRLGRLYRLVIIILPPLSYLPVFVEAPFLFLIALNGIFRGFLALGNVIRTSRKDILQILNQNIKSTGGNALWEASIANMLNKPASHASEKRNNFYIGEDKKTAWDKINIAFNLGGICYAVYYLNNMPVEEEKRHKECMRDLEEDYEAFMKQEEKDHENFMKQEEKNHEAFMKQEEKDLEKFRNNLENRHKEFMKLAKNLTEESRKKQEKDYEESRKKQEKDDEEYLRRCEKIHENFMKQYEKSHEESMKQYEKSHEKFMKQTENDHREYMKQYETSSEESEKNNIDFWD